MGLYVIIGIVILLIVYVLATYNNFVRINNIVKEAFSTMDVYLKKRWDLIPNLVETVKGYANYENETLEKIINLRNGNYDEMEDSKKIAVNQSLYSELSKIIAIAEAYPELKANENFLNFSSQLVKIEDDIANSRKYYNGAVKMLNVKVQSFPSNIIANIFGFKQANMFEANDFEKNNIKVEL